ncbi:UrcA family protein [Sphingomonas sp.]|uniref:UrcA family protein n=1 Tax=Sphingomonas sp. TaxID=28214 RepID=UPI003D6CD0C0
MKYLTLSSLLLLTACVGHGKVDRQVPDLALGYRDLPLETAAGRAVLAVRVARSAASFCRTYEPQDYERIFALGLANAGNCPGVASLMLARRMPAHVRRAYQAGRRGE